MIHELLRMECICKSFPNTAALRYVTLTAVRGEILALVGKNGSGKSTLLGILTGHLQEDSGTIYFNDKPLKAMTPSLARQLGIAAVLQGMSLIPNMDVAQNLFLGQELTRWRLVVNSKAMHMAAKEFLDTLGIALGPYSSVAALSLEQCQQLLLAKALIQHPKLLVLDEVTAAQTRSGIQTIQYAIKRAQRAGCTIIMITHALDEVLDMADRVMVLRDGISLGTYKKQECTKSMIINLMIGAQAGESVPNAEENRQTDGPALLRLNGLSVKPNLYNIHLTVRKGEIVGLIGLAGSGGSELLKAVYGLTPIRRGEILLHDKPVRISGPVAAFRLGIGYLSDNRRRDSLFHVKDLEFNLTICSTKRFSLFGILKRKLRRFLAKHYLELLDVTPARLEEPICHLSAGNQQKLLIGRWLAANVDLLLLDEPTVGLDVAAKQELLLSMKRQAQEKKSFLIVFSDPAEAIQVCDRIYIIKNGSLSEELSREEFQEEAIFAKLHN